MKTRVFPWITLMFALLLLLCTGAARAQDFARQDQAFLAQTAQNVHAETSAARMALGKTNHPQVRAFAQRMLDEHERVGQELSTLAASRNHEAPREPSLLQKGKEMVLGAMSEGNFDRRYVNQMGVEAHQSAIELFEKAERESRDPDIKAFVSKHLPALREHLQAALQIQAVVEGG